MCQFENENTPGFSLVAEGIQRYAAEAPPIIQRRWETVKAERQRSKEMAAKELLGFTESATAHKSTVDSAGHDIVPDGTQRFGPFIFTKERFYRVTALTLLKLTSKVLQR